METCHLRCENPRTYCRKPAKVWLWNPRKSEVKSALHTMFADRDFPMYYLVCGHCASRLPRTTRLVVAQ